MPGGLEGMMKNPQMMAMAQQMMKDPKVCIWIYIYIYICIYVYTYICIHIPMYFCILSYMVY
jgi:nitrate/nitrite transporter NarK